MALYKGIAFPDDVAPLARHMGSLNDHREALTVLSSTWDTLALLAQLSNLKADMGEVRGSFAALTGELLVCLAEESLTRAAEALGHQAQIAIDVLTRNLFERTADIGFLATDSVIVEACAGGDPAKFEALRQRLRIYRDRYTVYGDIVLMAPDGQVLSRLNEGFGGRSKSAIVGRALNSASGFVESWETTDFCGGQQALTYAWRVERNGRPVGVLALEFDLASEARMIFERLAADDELLAFVDASGRVVLSSDAGRLSPGRLVPLRADARAMRLAGVTYVAAQRAGQPYQGYAGPGWSVIALSPVELAFEQDGAPATDITFSGETVFSPRLLDVPVQARNVQRRLDRMVWNGRIHQASNANEFSRSLLQEIAATGRKTKNVFERATTELLTTVASGLLGEAEFLAGLSVDILDRNLYERANDCRWWAASPALATMDAAIARKTLAHINSLYTVYSDILLFDQRGRVIAASRGADVEGRALTDAWVADCLELRDPMRYVVSPFAANALYGGAGTYVYAAPILAGANDGGRAIGGVGLVFDSTPQFEAMLQAALPKKAGAVAAFCRRDGTMISRTAELPVTVPADVLALAPGRSWSGVLKQGELCFVVGATAGNGYREFKTTDRYDETVIGIIAIPCGTTTSHLADGVPQFPPVSGGTEIATFLIGGQLLGLVASAVVECIEVTSAVRVWRGGFAQRHVGFVTWNNMALPLIDISADVNAGPGAAQRHAIVLKAGEQWFGLLISDLGPVADMKLSEERGLTGSGDASKLIAQLGRAGSVLLPVLSPEAVFGASVG
ncbi:MAG: chemotaxis protein CheW [Burkholderiaceae bacterium]